MTDNPPTPEEADEGARPKARDVGFGTSGDARTGPADLLDSDLDDLPTLPRPPIQVDHSTAQPARVINYLRGGTVNFSADRDATDYITDALPGGIETARDLVLAGRAFQQRVIQHVIGTEGVRQVLYATSSIPEEPIHEFVQAVAPGVRVIYVLTDDNVLAHAHRLTITTPEVTTDYVRCHAGKPEQMLRQAQQTLDLDEPVLTNVDLWMLPDDDLAQHLIGLLRRSICPGSYMMVTALAGDIAHESLSGMLARLDEMVGQSKIYPVRFRSRAEVAGLLDGFELLEPGIVPLDEWRPDGEAPPRARPDVPLFVYGALGRKP